MPSQHSKFVSASCRDYVHPWTESCVSATAGLGLHALQESLRIYTTVYLFTLLMKGKVPKPSDIIKTMLGILQSTAFLSFSAFTYSMFICSLRRALGNFSVITVSFIPSFLSSFSAILIERPSRHTLLCLYVSNIATETLFRMGVWRGYYSVVPRGEVYIYGASMAVLLYLFRSKCNKSDSIYKIIRYIVGEYEGSEYLEKKEKSSTFEKNSTISIALDNDCPGPSHRGNVEKSKESTFRVLRKALEAYERIVNRIKRWGRHSSCPHPFSCVHYVSVGAAKLFSIGVGAQLALQLVFQMKRMINRPHLIKSTIFRRRNLNLGVFLGAFVGLYRLTSCSLRRARNGDSKYHAIPAGIIASVAFTMYPNNTIALYVMWKALQLLWNREVENGRLPEVKWFSMVLYCLSTALLFHAAIIEPQNLRPSYWKFLYNLSGGRLAAMCRVPLDEFGYESNKNLQIYLKQTGTTDKHTYSF